jgi:6-phosphogluconolactonase
VTLYGVELTVCEDAEEVAAVVADELVAAARSGQSIALTGGSSPARAYQLAAERDPDWSAASLWWGDERCVPPEDERSNFRLARENLLDRLEAPPREVQRIRGELDAEEAAREYDRLLRGSSLDFVLLGIGPDGHAASLFPDQPTLDERERLAIPAEAKLEPFVERVTLTLPALASAPAVVFIVTGEEKADAMERAFGRPPDRTTPSSLIRSAPGSTRVIADTAAASGLHG